MESDNKQRPTNHRNVVFAPDQIIHLVESRCHAARIARDSPPNGSEDLVAFDTEIWTLKEGLTPFFSSFFRSICFASNLPAIKRLYHERWPRIRTRSTLATMFPLTLMRGDPRFSFSARQVPVSSELRLFRFISV